MFWIEHRKSEVLAKHEAPKVEVASDKPKQASPETTLTGAKEETHDPPPLSKTPSSAKTPHKFQSDKDSRSSPQIGPIAGDSNVVGNTVKGDQNVLGNGNQVTFGIYPPRQIDEDIKKDAIPWLRELPAKVRIIYVQNDSEAYGYAQKIQFLLKSAGWDVDDPSGAMIFSNPPVYGVAVAYKGDTLTPNQRVMPDLGKAWGRLVRVVIVAQGGGDVYVNPSPSIDEQSIAITVYSSPKSKPQ
jgi:hypothetical protein